ncbi:MAG: fibro-slime domain-containing protein, partial [Nitrosotalea sp.]
MKKWNKNNPFRYFNRSKKGISTVISGAILLVGISLIGIIGVSWANDNLSRNEKILDNTYSTNINKIKESITPQNEWYKTAQKQLNITFLNTGIDGLNVTEVEIKGTNNTLDLRVPSTAVPPGKTFSKLINYNWTGNPLDISLITNRGSIFTNHLGTPADGQLVINKIAKQADGNFTFYGNLGNFWIQTAGHQNTANLDKNGNLVLSGIIHDFNGSAWPHGGDPDFEKVCPCNFGLYPGIVLSNLGNDSTPVYNNDTNSPFNNGPVRFHQWYHDTPGVNVEKPLNITLIAQGTNPQTWKYSNMSFFPIDNQLFGNSGQDAQGKWHNFGFTYEVHSSFTYQGGETFNFWGDDDVWVFINHKLAMDLGGVHAGAPGIINLDAQASQFGITRGGTYSFDFFYAERHTTSSEIQITTSIQLGTPGAGQSGVFFVDPGVYTVGETPTPGWTLQSATCDNTYTNPNATQVTVTVPK